MRRIPNLLPVTFLALAACAVATSADETTASTSSALTPAITEVTGFGSNPGALKMYEHVPAGLAAGAPLVLVLHGCDETAASSATTGWTELADSLKLTVVYPEQQTSNNPLKCFNWAGEYGDPANLERGKGENLSIKQMVDKAIADHGSDPKRVFVVGFSAGGGTAAIMAATYPEVFAGAATIGGLPYNCTTTLAEVNGCMKPGKTKTAADWAALVKAADPGFAGPWPRFSIWQGAADTTVAPANRMELVKQWTGVHGIDAVAPVADTVDGQSHAVYKNAAGKVLVETYEVAGMTHGVPVAPAAGCGTAATYAFDKGICAASRIASYFGLTSSSSPADAGADAKKPGTSSGAVSSSSSTGGTTSGAATTSGGAATSSGGAASSSGDGASSGSAAAPSASGDPNTTPPSTCTIASPIGSSTSRTHLALFAFLLTLTVALARTRTRSRSDKAVSR
ncbi:MAG: Esterase, depolymerase family [Labilithrix sp.]|nr:Esterase, depolymerase family [Labilithrix sp.]